MPEELHSLSKTTKLLLLDSLLQEVCIESGSDGSLALSSLGLSVCLVSHNLLYSGLKKAHLTLKSKEKDKYLLPLICFKRWRHPLSPVVGIIVSCYAFGSNGHMGECLMRAVITHRFSTFIALLQWLADLLSVTFLFIWKPCCLSFPNSKDICCLPHQHDNLFTVCQSLVGLDTIL